MLTHRSKWVKEARPNQLPPNDNEWDIWLVLAGRGFGKTRLGAEAIAWDSWQQPETISHVVAATHGDLRSVCYEGASGLLSVIPPECLKNNGYNRSLGELYLTNGSVIRGFSAEAPDRARGPQCHRMWGDELASWDHKGQAQDMFDMAMLGLRLGKRSYAIFTTTPKPIRLIRNLVNLGNGKINEDNKTLAQLRVRLTRGHTQENFNNLSRNFQILVTQFEGTRLGRQELEAEVLEDIQGALWEYDSIHHISPSELPELVRVLVSIDPAASSNEDSDENGIIVAGVDEGGYGYVLEDASGIMSPNEWGQRAIDLYRKWSADTIIGEVNNGGEMIEAVLRGIDTNIPFKAMRASRGKVARAEPVAALYEQKKVFHCGSFAKLEDQLCGLTLDFNRAKAKYSPDRADALVWAMSELMLGEMDGMGIYEYYRRASKNAVLEKTKSKFLKESDLVKMRAIDGKRVPSVVFGPLGEKINVENNMINVDPVNVELFMKHGFEKVG